MKAGTKGEVGIIVLSIQPGGPAEQAGLLIGDIILTLDDLDLEDVSDLQSVLQADKIGQPLRAKIIRAGNPIDLNIVLAERPAGIRQ